MFTGLTFQLYFEYVIRNVQAKHEELNLNVAQNTIEKFVAARREIGLEVNAEKTNYIFMFQEDNAE